MSTSVQTDPKCPSCRGPSIHNNATCKNCWSAKCEAGAKGRMLRHAMDHFTIDDLEVLIRAKKQPDDPIIDSYVADYEAFLLIEREKK